MNSRRLESRPVRSVALRFELLLFVEGDKTEEQYFTAWHRRFRDTVNVEFSPLRGAPYSLVEAAVAAKKREVIEQRRGRGRAHDQIWCVFDRDEHPNMAQAFNLAADHDIKIAFSNPCLELWFLIHFENQTGELHRHAAQRASKEHLKCDKNLSAGAIDALTERYEEAKKHALRLDAKHEGDGSPAQSNPSSNVWRLVDAIKSPRNSGS